MQVAILRRCLTADCERGNGAVRWTDAAEHRFALKKFKHPASMKGVANDEHRLAIKFALQIFGAVLDLLDAVIIAVGHDHVVTTLLKSQ